MRIKRPLKRVLSTRLLYTFMLIGAQATLLFYAFSQLTIVRELQLALNLLSAVLAFMLVSKYENSAYKLSWIIIILMLPAFGAVIYLLFGNKAAGKPMIKWVRNITYKGGLAVIKEDKDALCSLEKKDASSARIARYISNTGMLPLRKNCGITFLNSGEKWFFAFLDEIKKAKDFIFLEFFIIEEGEMWNTILSELAEKAKKGVDVRVIYDDIGCVKTLPAKYDRYLISLGIKCHVFNRLVPVLSIRHNNRDHRKICVIDGKAAFTGGINLADEYINKKQKFGHWYDNGILMRGSCVDNMTALFLSAWNFLENRDDLSIGRYLCKSGQNEGAAYCLPFTTSPYSSEDLAANTFLQLISRAEKYIYITTPYFILDFSMQQALVTAAESGIDVRIILPGVPDKPLLYEIAHCYFEKLINSGVRIYKYTPGFMHAKMCVSDDIKCLTGSINLDYRSLYLHFENACYIHDKKTAEDMKQCFFELFDASSLVTEEDLRKESIFKKILRSFFLPFAPFI